MKKKAFPLERVYQLLEPAPVVMVSTAIHGKPNIMTMAWYMMVDFMPPLINCVISDRNYSFNAVMKTKELVINIPTVELAPTAVNIGKCSGAETDKFKKFGLTQLPAAHVQAPLIGECYANVECKVISTRQAKKYNIFMLEAVGAWVTPSKKRPITFHHWGNGKFVADGKVFKLPFRSIKDYDHG